MSDPFPPHGKPEEGTSPSSLYSAPTIRSLDIPFYQNDPTPLQKDKRVLATSEFTSPESSHLERSDTQKMVQVFLPQNVVERPIINSISTGPSEEIQNDMFSSREKMRTNSAVQGSTPVLTDTPVVEEQRTTTLIADDTSETIAPVETLKPDEAVPPRSHPSELPIPPNRFRPPSSSYKFQEPEEHLPSASSPKLQLQEMKSQHRDQLLSIRSLLRPRDLLDHPSSLGQDGALVDYTPFRWHASGVAGNIAPVSSRRAFIPESSLTTDEFVSGIPLGPSVVPSPNIAPHSLSSPSVVAELALARHADEMTRLQCSSSLHTGSQHSTSQSVLELQRMKQEKEWDALKLEFNLLQEQLQKEEGQTADIRRALNLEELENASKGDYQSSLTQLHSAVEELRAEVRRSKHAKKERRFLEEDSARRRKRRETHLHQRNQEEKIATTEEVQTKVRASVEEDMRNRQLLLEQRENAAYLQQLHNVMQNLQTSLDDAEEKNKVLEEEGNHQVVAAARQWDREIGAYKEQIGALAIELDEAREGLQKVVAESRRRREEADYQYETEVRHMEEMLHSLRKDLSASASGQRVGLGLAALPTSPSPASSPPRGGRSSVPRRRSRRRRRQPPRSTDPSRLSAESSYPVSDTEAVRSARRPLPPLPSLVAGIGGSGRGGALLSSRSVHSTNTSVLGAGGIVPDGPSPVVMTSSTAASRTAVSEVRLAVEALRQQIVAAEKHAVPSSTDGLPTVEPYAPHPPASATLLSCTSAPLLTSARSGGMLSGRMPAVPALVLPPSRSGVTGTSCSASSIHPLLGLGHGANIVQQFQNLLPAIAEVTNAAAAGESDSDDESNDAADEEMAQLLEELSTLRLAVKQYQEQNEDSFLTIQAAIAAAAARRREELEALRLSPTPPSSSPSTSSSSGSSDDDDDDDEGDADCRRERKGFHAGSGSAARRRNESAGGFEGGGSTPGYSASGSGSSGVLWMSCDEIDLPPAPGPLQLRQRHQHPPLIPVSKSSSVPVPAVDSSRGRSMTIPTVLAPPSMPSPPPLPRQPPVPPLPPPVCTRQPVVVRMTSGQTSDEKDGSSSSSSSTPPAKSDKPEKRKVEKVVPQSVECDCKEKYIQKQQEVETQHARELERLHNTIDEMNEHRIAELKENELVRQAERHQHEEEVTKLELAIRALEVDHARLKAEAEADATAAQAALLAAEESFREKQLQLEMEKREKDLIREQLSVREGEKDSEERLLLRHDLMKLEEKLHQIEERLFQPSANASPPSTPQELLPTSSSLEREPILLQRIVSAHLESVRESFDQRLSEMENLLERQKSEALSRAATQMEKELKDAETQYENGPLVCHCGNPACVEHPSSSSSFRSEEGGYEPVEGSCAPPRPSQVFVHEVPYSDSVETPPNEDVKESEWIANQSKELEELKTMIASLMEEREKDRTALEKQLCLREAEVQAEQEQDERMLLTLKKEFHVLRLQHEEALDALKHQQRITKERMEDAVSEVSIRLSENWTRSSLHQQIEVGERIDSLRHLFVEMMRHDTRPNPAAKKEGTEGDSKKEKKSEERNSPPTFDDTNALLRIRHEVEDIHKDLLFEWKKHKVNSKNTPAASSLTSSSLSLSPALEARFAAMEMRMKEFIEAVTRQQSEQCQDHLTGGRSPEDLAIGPLQEELEQLRRTQESRAKRAEERERLNDEWRLQQLTRMASITDSITQLQREQLHFSSSALQPQIHVTPTPQTDLHSSLLERLAALSSHLENQLVLQREVSLAADRRSELREQHFQADMSSTQQRIATLERHLDLFFQREGSAVPPPAAVTVVTSPPPPSSSPSQHNNEVALIEHSIEVQRRQLQEINDALNRVRQRVLTLQGSLAEWKEHDEAEEEQKRRRASSDHWRRRLAELEAELRGEMNQNEVSQRKANDGLTQLLRHSHASIDALQNVVADLKQNVKQSIEQREVSARNPVYTHDVPESSCRHSGNIADGKQPVVILPRQGSTHLRASGSESISRPGSILAEVLNGSTGKIHEPHSTHLVAAPSVALDNNTPLLEKRSDSQSPLYDCLREMLHEATVAIHQLNERVNGLQVSLTTQMEKDPRDQGSNDEESIAVMAAHKAQENLLAQIDMYTLPIRQLQEQVDALQRVLEKPLDQQNDIPTQPSEKLGALCFEDAIAPSLGELREQLRQEREAAEFLLSAQIIRAQQEVSQLEDRVKAMQNVLSLSPNPSPSIASHDEDPAVGGRYDEEEELKVKLNGTKDGVRQLSHRLSKLQEILMRDEENNKRILTPIITEHEQGDPDVYNTTRTPTMGQEERDLRDMNNVGSRNTNALKANDSLSSHALMDQVVGFHSAIDLLQNRIKELQDALDDAERDRLRVQQQQPVAPLPISPPRTDEIPSLHIRKPLPSPGTFSADMESGLSHPLDVLTSERSVHLAVQPSVPLCTTGDDVTQMESRHHSFLSLPSAGDNVRSPPLVDTWKREEEVEDEPVPTRKKADERSPCDEGKKKSDAAHHKPLTTVVPISVMELLDEPNDGDETNLVTMLRRTKTSLSNIHLRMGGLKKAITDYAAERVRVAKHQISSRQSPSTLSPEERKRDSTEKELLGLVERSEDALAASHVRVEHLLHTLLDKVDNPFPDSQKESLDRVSAQLKMEKKTLRLIIRNSALHVVDALQDRVRATQYMEERADGARQFRPEASVSSTGSGSARRSKRNKEERLAASLRAELEGSDRVLSMLRSRFSQLLPLLCDSSRSDDEDAGSSRSSSAGSHLQKKKKKQEKPHAGHEESPAVQRARKALEDQLHRSDLAVESLNRRLQRVDKELQKVAPGDPSMPPSSSEAKNPEEDRKLQALQDHMKKSQDAVKDLHEHVLRLERALTDAKWGGAKSNSSSRGAHRNASPTGSRKPPPPMSPAAAAAINALQRQLKADEAERLMLEKRRAMEKEKEDRDRKRLEDQLEALEHQLREAQLAASLIPSRHADEPKSVLVSDRQPATTESKEKGTDPIRTDNRISPENLYQDHIDRLKDQLQKNRNDLANDKRDRLNELQQHKEEQKNMQRRIKDLERQIRALRDGRHQPSRLEDTSEKILPLVTSDVHDTSSTISQTSSSSSVSSRQSSSASASSRRDSSSSHSSTTSCSSSSSALSATRKPAERAKPKRPRYSSRPSKHSPPHKLRDPKRIPHYRMANLDHIPPKVDSGRVKRTKKPSWSRRAVRSKPRKSTRGNKHSRTDLSRSSRAPKSAVSPSTYPTSPSSPSTALHPLENKIRDLQKKMKEKEKAAERDRKAARDALRKVEADQDRQLTALKKKLADQERLLRELQRRSKSPQTESRSPSSSHPKKKHPHRHRHHRRNSPSSHSVGEPGMNTPSKEKKKKKQRTREKKSQGEVSPNSPEESKKREREKKQRDKKKRHASPATPRPHSYTDKKKVDQLVFHSNTSSPIRESRYRISPVDRGYRVYTAVEAAELLRKKKKEEQQLQRSLPRDRPYDDEYFKDDTDREPKKRRKTRQKPKHSRRKSAETPLPFTSSHGSIASGGYLSSQPSNASIQWNQGGGQVTDYRSGATPRPKNWGLAPTPPTDKEEELSDSKSAEDSQKDRGNSPWATSDKEELSEPPEKVKRLLNVLPEDVEDLPSGRVVYHTPPPSAAGGRYVPPSLSKKKKQGVVRERVKPRNASPSTSAKKTTTRSASDSTPYRSLRRKEVSPYLQRLGGNNKNRYPRSGLLAHHGLGYVPYSSRRRGNRSIQSPSSTYAKYFSKSPDRVRKGDDSSLPSPLRGGSRSSPDSRRPASVEALFDMDHDQYQHLLNRHGFFGEAEHYLANPHKSRLR